MSKHYRFPLPHSYTDLNGDNTFCERHKRRLFAPRQTNGRAVAPWRPKHPETLVYCALSAIYVHCIYLTHRLCEYVAALDTRLFHFCAVEMELGLILLPMTLKQLRLEPWEIITLPLKPSCNTSVLLVYCLRLKQREIQLTRFTIW